MQNNLLRSLLKKQLIYAKQLIMISFKKNSLFEIAYLCKTAYYDLILKTTYSKELSYAKQLIRNNLFMQNNSLGSLFLKPLIRNTLFMQNNLLRSHFFFKKKKKISF